MKKIMGDDLRKSDGAQVQKFNIQDAEKLFSLWGKEAVQKGETRGWLKKKIVEYLNGLVQGDKLIEINGQAYRVREFAEIAARTKLREAQTKATLKSCREYKNDLVEVSHHGTTCEICKEFEGKIFSISGKHLKYPKLKKMPPFHLACGHSISPTSEVAIEARKKYA